jgi:hypothetical protein
MPTSRNLSTYAGHRLRGLQHEEVDLDNMVLKPMSVEMYRGDRQVQLLKTAQQKTPPSA